MEASKFLLLVTLGDILLVFSYLVIPAVVAVLFAESITVRLVIGWLVGTVVSIVGIVLSYTNDLPSGPTIVVCFAGFLVLAALGRYILFSSSRLRSGFQVGAGAVILFLFLGESLCKEETPDIAFLIMSLEKNERLMGLKIIEEDPSLWTSLSSELSRLLNDPEPEVRVSSLSMIEKYAGSDLSDNVVILLEDWNDTVREAAIKCLSNIGDDSILSPLQVRGWEEEDPYLRIEIADLILKLGDERGLQILVDIMDHASASQARKDSYQRLVDHTGTDLPFDGEVPESQNDDKVASFRKLYK
jgi:hypothetical protein